MMTSYKWSVRLRILANLALAIYALWMPGEVIKLLRLETPSDPVWVQAFAILVIFVTLAYVPSTVAPLKSRSHQRVHPGRTYCADHSVVLARVGRKDIAVSWLWRFYELAFAVLLWFTFQRGWVADLMSKP